MRHEQDFKMNMGAKPLAITYKQSFRIGELANLEFLTPKLDEIQKALDVVKHIRVDRDVFVRWKGAEDLVDELALHPTFHFFIFLENIMRTFSKKRRDLRRRGKSIV